MNISTAPPTISEISTVSSEINSRIHQMPKIELHRHLTGSVTPELAYLIIKKHGINFPSNNIHEIRNIIQGTRSVNSLNEYFQPWKMLNKLFVSKKAIFDIVHTIIKNAYLDNVVYIELRMAPRGLLSTPEISFEDFLQTVEFAAMEADLQFGTTTRCIIGIPRHIFGPIPKASRKKMMDFLLDTVLRNYHNFVVGFDLNGDELSIDADEFEFFFSEVSKSRLNITIHAGEVGPASNIQYAVNTLHADRIGHGIAASTEPNIMEMLHENDCALEICPTSNKILGVINDIPDLPLPQFLRKNVPFVICTDNPARCDTSLTAELQYLHDIFNLQLDDIQNIVFSALEYSFADERTKIQIRRKFH